MRLSLCPVHTVLCMYLIFFSSLSEAFRRFPVQSPSWSSERWCSHSSSCLLAEAATDTSGWGCWLRRDPGRWKCAFQCRCSGIASLMHTNTTPVCHRTHTRCPGDTEWLRCSGSRSHGLLPDTRPPPGRLLSEWPNCRDILLGQKCRLSFLECHQSPQEFQTVSPPLRQVCHRTA